MDAREFELLRSYYAEKIDYRLKEIFSSLEDEVKKECEEEGIGQPLSSFLEDSVGYMGEFVSPTGKKDNLIRPGAKVVPPKRLRPFVGCMSYFGFGGSEEEAILNFMVGIELKHYGTLLHDDLIDKDPSRHSTKTYWNYMEEKYGEGNAHAICAGDAFIEISNSIFSDPSSPFKPKRLLNTINYVSKRLGHLSRGEMLDVKMSHEKKLKEEDYFYMVKLKTAELLATSAVAGGMLAGASEKQLKPLEEGMRLCGELFQLTDDYISLMREDKETGKKRGNDMMQGRGVLYLIKVFEMGNESQIQKVKNVMRKGQEASEKEVQEAIDAIIESGAYDYCKRKAKEFAEEGKRKLSEIYPPLIESYRPRDKGLRKILIENFGRDHFSPKNILEYFPDFVLQRIY